MSGFGRIHAERRRQMSAEGYSAAHDDAHRGGELLLAAILYLHAETDDAAPVDARGVPLDWPWELEAWKPKGRVRNLERAGALAVAEVDRLTRAGGVTAGAETVTLMARDALDALLDGRAAPLDLSAQRLAEIGNALLHSPNFATCALAAKTLQALAVERCGFAAAVTAAAGARI